MPRRQKSLVQSRSVVQPPAATNGNGHVPNGKLVASATTQGMIEVTNRDRMLFQLWGDMRPDQLAGILRQALIGNLVWQERLFEKMVDEWPRLQKNIQSLKNDVADLDWTIEPFAEKDTEATESAQEKAQLVERALHGMEADPTLDTSDFSGMIKDIIDATLCGFSISEIKWIVRDGERVPQFTKKLPARFFGYGLMPDQPDQLLLNPLGNLSFTSDSLIQFPPNKFLIGVYKSNLSHPSIGAKLRCLCQQWFAHKYGLKWFMLFAQIFGSPFRLAKYTPGDQTTFNSLCSMLEQMGNTGWGAFPEGSSVEFMESKTSNGTMLPQRVLSQDANEECDLTILGQVLTSTAGRAGGNRALGEVHADTERKVLNGTAKFVKTVLKQLIKAIVFLNYGETSELPTAKGADEEEQDELAIAQTAAIKYGSDTGQLAIPVSMDKLCAELGITEPDKDAKLYMPKSIGNDPIYGVPDPPPMPALPFGAGTPPGGAPPKPGEPTPTPDKATASDCTPSMQMAVTVKRGLDARKKTGRGGSLSAVTRARDISARKALPVSTVRRMQIYFDSHAADAKADPQSAAGIAWALHGGNAGRAWVDSVCRTVQSSLVNAFNENHEPGGTSKGGEFASGGGGGFISDGSGKPVVYLHGTTHGGFDKFKLPDETDPEYGVHAVFFTTDPEVSKQFTKRGAYDKEVGKKPELIKVHVKNGRVLDMQSDVRKLSVSDKEDIAKVQNETPEDIDDWAEDRAKKGKPTFVSNYLYQGGATDMQDLDASSLERFDAIKDGNLLAVMKPDLIEKIPKATKVKKSKGT